MFKVGRKFMTEVFRVKSEEETKTIAKSFASKLNGKETIILTGDLRFR